MIYWMVITDMEINKTRRKCRCSGVVVWFKKDGQGLCYREGGIRAKTNREGASHDFQTEGTPVWWL